MPKLIMGRDITTLSKEEMAELMAEMRSRRKGTNGREGYRNPNGLVVRTNNFPDPTKKRKVGELAKLSNEHVKCVFICPREIYQDSTAYGQIKIYYIGFLSDSNKYSFEEFREAPPKCVKDEFGGIKYRLQKYSQLFEKKNIDKDTIFVICKDETMKETDFMVALLRFIRAFTGCEFLKTSKVKLIKEYVREYGIFRTGKDKFNRRPTQSAILKNCEIYKPRMINALIYDIYEYIAKQGICPWITKETHDIVLNLPKQKKHSHQLVSLGLFYSVIVKFRKMSRTQSKAD